MTKTQTRLRELPDWPPQPGGAYERGTRFPTAGEAIVTEIVPVREKAVTFRGVFDGRSHSYHHAARTEAEARKIYDAIGANLGLTVQELGEVTIEFDA